MKKLHYFCVLVLFIFSAKLLSAQTLQPEEISYMPDLCVNIVKAPSYAPKTDIINLVEQNGLYPYKGKSCDDKSSSFEVGANGKEYGSNEYCKIFLKLTQYGPAAKELFKQTKPYDVMLEELKSFAASSKTEPDAVGTRKSRDVISKDVGSGKMVLVVDVINCIESKNSEYTVINFRSVTLVGSTIISIMGSYNSGDNGLPEQICGEIIGKVN